MLTPVLALPLEFEFCVQEKHARPVEIGQLQIWKPL